MKVILLRDVARLGKKSEVKEVPDGHAINFLIPRKLATTASPENLKRVANEKDKQAQTSEAMQKSFREALKAHAETKVVYSAEASEQGHLFKGLHAEDIARVLSADGFTLTKQHVKIEHPIKETGIHTIPLEQMGVKGTVQLEVVKK